MKSFVHILGQMMLETRFASKFKLVLGSKRVLKGAVSNLLITLSKLCGKVN